MNKLVRKSYLPSLWQEDPNLFFAPIERHLQTVLDSMFGDSFLDSATTFTNVFDKNSYPKVNVVEEIDRVIVEAEIPGLSKEDVSVTISHNCLVIRGEKKKDAVERKGTYLRKELRHSSFSRCVGELGENINKDSIVAEFKDGILTVTMNKIKPTHKVEEVKKIEIK